MKIYAITPVFNEPLLLDACLKCFHDHVDVHVVCVGQSPYFNKDKYAVDKDTQLVAHENGSVVIVGDWSLDCKQRNTAIEYLINNKNVTDADWIICLDADMLMTKSDIKKFIRDLKSLDEYNTGIKSVRLKQYAYWFDLDHRFANDPFCPIMAIKPSVRFKHIGDVNVASVLIGESENIRVHHINWCYPKDIKKKVETYSHHNEIPSDWYEKNFVNWREGEDANLPDCKLSVNAEPLPNELKKYLAC